MPPAPLPVDEPARLEALRSYHVLDTEPEQRYDDLTLIASQICGTPIALISLLDEDRQWFKSRVGLDAQQTPRDLAFCAHAILNRETCIVPDAQQDERFRENPLVTGDPRIRFYAGAPLVVPGGQAMGTLCVIDRKPRELSEDMIRALGALARQVVTQMELGKKIRALEETGRALLEAKQAVEQSSRERSRFFAHMSHELRTPLNSIIGFSGVLRKPGFATLKPKELDMVERIHTNGLQLLELVNDVLDLSKLEAGGMEVHRSSFEVKPLLHELASQLEPLLEARSNQLELHLAAELGSISTDRMRVRQCLLNLLSNACKFTESGKITLSAERRAEDDDERVVFRVRDTGIGIPPEQQERLFDEYAQVSPSHESSVTGTGLGLAITRKLCQLLSGDISVESEPGVGSVFTIMLPVV